MKEFVVLTQRLSKVAAAAWRQERWSGARV